MTSQPAPTPESHNISWEGDKMFNIYIHDYCSKRGFRRTAKELMQEAEISVDAAPPINARQGLLFEWWSVFWVLFQAKSNGGGSDDGLVYIHHQAAQRQQANQRNLIVPAQLPTAGQPSQPPMQQPPQQPPITRLPNGMPPGNAPPAMNRPPSTYLANGAMPNGVGMNPAMGGQPPQQSAPMNFGGMGNHPQPQANGIPPSAPGVVGQPQPPQQQQQPQQGMPAQAMPFGMPTNQQRPPSMMNGVTPQPRGPPNGGPFHGSPTMAHSPQHSTGTPGHPGQHPQPGPSQPSQPGHPQGGPGQQPAMSQLAGPSPNMAPMNRVGTMMPPTPGMSPMNSGQPLQQQGPPTPGYQHQQLQNQGGRPPSRTNTPRSGMMTHPSPSLAARQTPGGPIGMAPGQSTMGMPAGMAGNNGMNSGNNSDQMNHEIMQIPQNMLNNLKMEMGCGDKDLSTLTMAEKNRIITTWRMRTPGQQRKDVPGPTGLMTPPGQPGQPLQRPGQPQPQRSNKRNSTSPSEEHETLPHNESSPPDRKRIRRSPGEPGLGQMAYPHLPTQQQPGPPGQPQPGLSMTTQQQQQMNSLMMMRNNGGGLMNGGMPLNVGGPGGPPPQQQHPGLQQAPPLGGPPGMQSMMQMHGPGSMMSPQQQQQQMQANQQAQQHAQAQQQAQAQAQQQQQQQQPQTQLFRMQKAPGAPEHTFNQGAPTGSGPPFNSPLNRLQNKPPVAGMMPPPSPAINGPPKDGKQDGNNANKPPVNANPPPNQQSSHNPDGSPRNQPPGPSGSGTAPPTPVPSNQPNPQQQQQQQQQPQNHLNMMSTSMLGMPPSGGGIGPDMNLFDNSFMDTMSTPDFDPAGLFRSDDINFERDFGQWFNPDDAVLNASLDMK